MMDEMRRNAKPSLSDVGIVATIHLVCQSVWVAMGIIVCNFIEYDVPWWL